MLTDQRNTVGMICTVDILDVEPWHWPSEQSLSQTQAVIGPHEMVQE